MITSLTEVSEIREAMQLGAQDYVFKDELAPEMLLPIVESIQERLQLAKQVADLEQREREWGLAALVGSSSPMEKLRWTITRVADADAPVLIRGETGTGKELVARAIHQLSSRSSHSFVAVNCSALPGTLIRSLMFGHGEGLHWSGPEDQGQFKVAGSGTILLDEIAKCQQTSKPNLRVPRRRVVSSAGQRTRNPAQGSCPCGYPCGPQT